MGPESRRDSGPVCYLLFSLLAYFIIFCAVLEIGVEHTLQKCLHNSFVFYDPDSLPKAPLSSSSRASSSGLTSNHINIKTQAERKCCVKYVVKHNFLTFSATVLWPIVRRYDGEIV